MVMHLLIFSRKNIIRALTIFTVIFFVISTVLFSYPDFSSSQSDLAISKLAPPMLTNGLSKKAGRKAPGLDALDDIAKARTADTISIGNATIVLGNLGPKVTSVTAADNRVTLTNTAGQHLVIEMLPYGSNSCLRIGNATYIIRDHLQTVDISTINPLGNIAFIEFFGLRLENIAPANVSFALPVDEPQRTKPVDLFPANRIQQADFLPARVSQQAVDGARAYAQRVYGLEKIEAPLYELLHNLAILGMNGSWQDYYVVQDVLNRVIKDNIYPQQQELIIGLADYLYFIYVGCDWLKWQDLSRQRQEEARAAAVQTAEAKPASRTRTLFELPVEPTRIPFNDPQNWEVAQVEALGDKDLDYIPTEPTSEEVGLGDEAIRDARVVSVPFCGGAATTVKKLIGMHKLVHKALKVITNRAGRRMQKWISIVQARIGFIFGQNPRSEVVLVTSVGGTIEGESDRSIRESLAQQYQQEMDTHQIYPAMQRAGLVLDPKTGYPLRFSDGHVATCAENHLWAFLAVLMDKDLMIDMLEHTDAVVCAGNGDNVLNFPRAGMVGRILKARQERKPLATIAICTPSAGDRKGGIGVRVTYRNKQTGQTYTQIELREISEFPMRSKEKGFKGIDISKEAGSDFYRLCEEKGLFIEDIFGNKRVAFNVAFYAVDMRLFVARIFGLDENDPALVDKLKAINPQIWSTEILSKAKEVPASRLPSKEVPNEDGTSQVTGFITEQMVQDFIVNGLGLLAREGLPDPVVDIQLAEREDVFLPYKGTDQTVLDRAGNPVAGKTDYDLIANQQRYAGVTEELAAKGHRIELGGEEEVERIIPVDSRDDVMIVNRDPYLDFDYAPAQDALVATGTSKVIVLEPQMLGEALGFKAYLEGLIANTQGKFTVI
ncbi:MAG: hypothetical protein V1893_03155, partial [Candidatus Omnitrophota bacterium]